MLPPTVTNPLGPQDREKLLTVLKILDDCQPGCDELARAGVDVRSHQERIQECRQQALAMLEAFFGGT